MKKLFSLGIGLALLAGINANAQNVASRLAKIENPPSITIASNSTTAQIDFTGTGENVSAPVFDYIINQLSTAITLYPTNLKAGRKVRIFLDTDGTARAITIPTNGLPGCEIVWPSYVGTNGSATFSVTNKAWVEIICRNTNVLWGTINIGR